MDVKKAHTTNLHDLTFSGTTEKDFLEIMFLRLPKFTFYANLTLRAIITMLVCEATWKDYQQNGWLVRILFAFGIPVVLQICLMVFSLITSKLLSIKRYGWFVVFFIFTISGVLYNTYHLLNFVETEVFKNPKLTLITLIFVDVFAWVLSEATGLLLVFGLAEKELKIAKTNQPTNQPEFKPIYNPYNEVLLKPTEYNRTPIVKSDHIDNEFVVPKIAKDHPELYKHLVDCFHSDYPVVFAELARKFKVRQEGETEDAARGRVRRFWEKVKELEEPHKKYYAQKN